MNTIDARPSVASLDDLPADIAQQRRRILVSGMIGTTIEYFDFFVYGLLAPAVFGRLFFPSSDGFVATIAVLGTFAIGYAARPLGGIVFGHYGDRIGRKPTMFITLTLMGVATTIIGLLPTYAMIGVAAPILLTLMRFLQGFAIGGETAGAVILALETAPGGKRGGFAGIIQVGAALGSLFAALAAGMVARMPEADMLSWGWRVPFLLSILLLAVGMYIRAKVDESPAFKRAIEARAPERLPLATALGAEPKPALIVFLCMITETSMLQMFTVFALVFGVRDLGIDRSVLLSGIFLGNIAGIVTNPLFGRMSDFVGRRPMMAAAVVNGMIYVAFFFFPMLATKDPFWVQLAIAIPPAVIQTMIFSVEGSFYAELFRNARYRFSGLGFSRQMGGLVGGLFPLIGTALFAATQSVWGPISYYLLVSVVTLSAIYAARETSRELI